MRVKRLLTMLLVLCMMISVVSPAASAVAPAANSIVASKNEEDTATKVTTSPFENDLFVSDDTVGFQNLRDESLMMPEVETTENGSWTATIVEGLDAPINFSETPECIAELKEAAEIYDASDMVTAFVVMEDSPLAEMYSSIDLVRDADEEALLKIQDSIIAMIEKYVMDGEELDVRYQFTYLTNAFSIATEFGKLSEIAMMDGVKSVYLMPVYNACTVEPGTANPNTASAGNMTNVAQVWKDLGYRGEGMKIAVIDTGLDLDHPSFAAAPELTDDSLTIEDIDAVLEDLNAYEKRSTIRGKTLYRSAKVPYAFNYVDNSLTADHSSDMQGDHGTHVSGIAAANPVEGTTVVGMAPEAQIIVMKVFGAAGGAYTDDIVAALEDAMILGCDVVNLSLGSAAGFTSTNTEIDLIYERLAEQDIIATISAGNEGTSAYDNMWGTDLNRTQNPDNATVGQPGTYANATTIASAENAEMYADYIALANGTKVVYNNCAEWYYGYVGGLDMIEGQELEYYVIDGLGEEADFYDAEGNSLVDGKVAVVSRGTINFGLKVLNAEMAGAVACLIWNNASGNVLDFYMSIALTDAEGNEFYPSIPAALISLEDGEAMKNAETKTMTVAEDQTIVQTSAGGQMSSFSSWGVAPNLTLEPDVTGIGGNVYSCYDGGGYGYMSGTSMSAPQVAGVTALVMQYLHETYPDAATGEIRTMANALLMSTADPIISAVSGAEASPRQQGAGLVDAFEAISTNAYLTVNGDMPKVSMGDSANGTYTFSFEIHNISDEAKTYTFGSSLLTEYAVSAQLSETEYEYFMYGEDVALSGDVSFDKESVTVEPGKTATINVSIKLSDDDKAYFDAYWENGGYVEGYVYLYTTTDEGVVSNELNLPFLGFYGDWTQAPAFDTAYWYDNSFWGVPYATGLPEGDEYHHVMWTSLAGQSWVLGFNPYTGVLLDENGNVIYDPANNSLSPNGDGVMDKLDDIYLSLLRNAKTLTITYTNAETGEVLSEEVITDARKTMYQSAYGQVIPWLYSWYGMGMYDFTDANGEYLPNNTKVLVTFDADVDYADGGEHTIEIPLTVDTEAPQLKLDVQYTWQGNKLVVLATENVALADVFVMNNSGTQIWAEQPEFIELTDGLYQIELDVTGLGNSFTVCLCDYAGNEGYFQVNYDNFFAGENLPQVDTTKLYAYRTYDNYIYSDHMYGWVSMNKPASAEEYANLSIHTDDYLEYAAINAAEYVDGYVFAVDAVYNLMIMRPGLWDRTTIANLGVNVLDMTFDDSTDTMYVLAKDGYYVSLCSMDLLTGELTELYDYGYYNYAPYAIADDDNGTLYAIKYGKANLFTLDENYEMVALTDAEGNAIVITDANGSNCNPNYAQSLTYSDGILYWGYFTSSWRGESSCLISIDVEALTGQTNAYAAMAYDAEGNLIEYYPTTELVALHTLTETEYQIPAAEALESLWMEESFMVLNVGETSKLKANPLPWNYEVTDLTWTSSDEAVVTVDANGNVTAVAEGSAVVTATSGDISVSVTITVVDVDGNFYAYNYYSGDNNYGYMIDVDLSPIGYTLTNESPADFIAGDYNGHDGYFYGITEGGQLWRYDMEANEAVKVGDATGINPVDMAYDYSTGLMYAAVVDYNYGCTYIYAVNLNNGQMMTAMEFYDGFLMTLACDLEGTLYAISMWGDLYQIDMETSEYSIMMSSLGDLQYMQSMCYDHNNDVILWTYPEVSQVFWIDAKAENPYVLALGDPSGSGLIEFVGMHTIPETIPELADVAVETVTAADMTILAGVEKTPAIAVTPFNATVQTAEMTSSDESVVKVTETGKLLAVAEGTATITYTLTDTVGGNTFEGSFQVTVIEPADDIYGHVLTDFASYGGQYWVRLYATNTSDPDLLDYTDYIIYAEEYYNGKLYAFGYDPNDWTGNWQMFVMDPDTLAVEEQLDLGEGYPFVYDVTYDYATSTMYAVAGPSDNASNIYVVDMETGELILLKQTEQFFMNIAATDHGIYVMEPSVAELDEYGWETGVYSNAILYKFDPISKEIEVVGDTGVKNNMLSSMSYDYDTGYLYWTPLFASSSYISSLAIVDTETGAATPLGATGAAGAQISGLYIISENFPAEPEPALNDLLVVPGKVSVTAGNTVEVKAYALPLSLDAAFTWTSSDETIATVENGVVTGVAQGKATITVTATYGDVTKTASCEVAVLGADAAFLTYNLTDGGFAAISRADSTVVGNLTTGEETPVAALTNIGDVVYGYDVNNTLFSLNLETMERTEIGQANAEQYITDYLVNIYGYAEEDAAAELDLYAFEVRDLAYDAANDRLLALGNVYDVEWGEINYGNGIYEVDLTTGELTLLYTFEDIYYVMAIAADAEGNVIYYNAYNDYYTSLNLETGIATNIVSLQTQSMYGDYESDHSIYYDDLTGLVYHLFTSNGSFYKMFSMDPITGSLTMVGEYVGEVIYDEDAWAYYGDCFVGLCFVDVEIPEVCEHAYETVTVDATCTEDGSVTYTCSICGHTYSEVIPATGHSYAVTDSKDATCTEDGYVTYTCACGDTYTETIPGGHSHEVTDSKDATCTEDGYVTYTCACGDTYTETIAATGHCYEAVVTAPTCVDQGYTTYTCSICGDSYVDDYVSATGEHNHQLVERVDPTCEENGYEFYRCDGCGDEYQVILEATGHNYEDGICTNCGAEEPSSGNGWFDWIEDWFGSWWGNGEEEEPSESETTKPEEDDAPGAGSWFDWIFGGWWN